jgi:hypothetical protein
MATNKSLLAIYISDISFSYLLYDEFTRFHVYEQMKGW